MSKTAVYESGYSAEKPVVFVDSEKYGDPGWESDKTGEYRPGIDRKFSESTGKRKLDFNVILKFFAANIEECFDIKNPEDILGYFVPVQDKQEIEKRQEAVKEIYENAPVGRSVLSIIKSANNLYQWNSRFLRASEGNFGKRTEQAANLVDFVEAALKLKAKSERLKNVKKFARTIAAREEYKELKSYTTEFASQFFREYDVCTIGKGTALRFCPAPETKNPSKYENKNLVVADILEMYSEMLNNQRKVRKIKLLDLETRRSIYRSLERLQTVYHKLMHDEKLKYIIDRKEAEAFKLEERLDEAIKRVGDTLILDSEQRGKIALSQSFFTSQFGQVLSHIGELIDEGLEKRMSSLEVRTNGLDDELAFYHVLAQFAWTMSHTTPVTMPTLLDKEKRYCDIKQGMAPSFVVRAAHAIRRAEEKSELVANDVHFNKKTNVFVITGPNDGGKTTYERMLGQMQVLAQVGSFVPAKKARMSIVDGIFTSFGVKDRPGEKEGSFKSGLKFLNYIAVPKIKSNESWEDDERWRLMSDSEIKTAYYHCDNSFITPYSLVLLDEIAIGSDSEATEEAIIRAINMGIARGARMYISTHHHPVAEMVQNGKFPGVINLGAMMNKKSKPPALTYKILPNRHEKSYGNRMFEASGFTDKDIAEGHRLLVEAGIIPKS